MRRRRKFWQFPLRKSGKNFQIFCCKNPNRAPPWQFSANFLIDLPGELYLGGGLVDGVIHSPNTHPWVCLFGFMRQGPRAQCLKGKRSIWEPQANRGTQKHTHVLKETLACGAKWKVFLPNLRLWRWGWGLIGGGGYRFLMQTPMERVYLGGVYLGKGGYFSGGVSICGGGYLFLSGKCNLCVRR